MHSTYIISSIIIKVTLNIKNIEIINMKTACDDFTVRVRIYGNKYSGKSAIIHRFWNHTVLNVFQNKRYAESPISKEIDINEKSFNLFLTENSHFMIYTWGAQLLGILILNRVI